VSRTVFRKLVVTQSIFRRTSIPTLSVITLYRPIAVAILVVFGRTPKSIELSYDRCPATSDRLNRSTRPVLVTKGRVDRLSRSPVAGLDRFRGTSEHNKYSDIFYCSGSRQLNHSSLFFMSPLRRHIFVCFMGKYGFFGPSSVKRGRTHIVLGGNMSGASTSTYPENLGSGGQLPAELVGRVCLFVCFFCLSVTLRC